MTSNQALQASTLIGQEVLLPGNIAYLGTEGDVSGVVINERTAQNMEITIENEIGEVLRVIDAGTQPAGNVEFSWDGTDQNGNRLPPGNYVVRAQGSVFGEETSIPTAGTTARRFGRRATSLSPRFWVATEQRRDCHS